jgi:hypothetical protein
MTDQTEDEPTSIEHRQLSAIAAAMRCLSHDGGVAPQPGRRHRTGRNVQLDFKVSAGTARARRLRVQRRIDPNRRGESNYGTPDPKRPEGHTEKQNIN